MRVATGRPSAAPPQSSPVAAVNEGAAATPPPPPPHPHAHAQAHAQAQRSSPSPSAPGFARKTPTADLVASVDAVLDGGVQWVERVACAENIEALLTDWGSLNTSDAERMRRGVMHLVSDQVAKESPPMQCMVCTHDHYR